MFNYAAIDKTPTVSQIKAIIEYMENDSENIYPFDFMMELDRKEPNKVIVDLNNAHHGMNYKVIFKEDGSIDTFEEFGSWIS